MSPGRPNPRPGWTHSDGHPYDDFDLGAARFEDELDIERRRAEVEHESSHDRRSLLRRLLAAIRPADRL
ncbi:MAG TPA: hypothetical protein VK488_13510 [Gaiellaceae bacterium]|nr:hypothetical protein [Gaiellaceae bacterium]